MPDQLGRRSEPKDVEKASTEGVGNNRKIFPTRLGNFLKKCSSCGRHYPILAVTGNMCEEMSDEKMKSTGTVRKLDPMGRVVLPFELRQTLNLKTDDALEIFIDGNKLVFRKYEPGCLLCGKIQNLKTVHGKNMCQKCLDDIKTST